MSKYDELNTVEQDVQDILRDCVEARCNDHMVYYLYAKKMIIRLHITENFETLFQHPRYFGISAFSTVERARRRVQQLYPELAEEDCKEKRFELQADFIEYSREAKND